MATPRDPTAPAPAEGFGSTNWSLILTAQRNEDRGAALNQLCRRYWKPVYVFARRDGLAAHDAEDATQDFFAHILSRDWIDRADEQRGSFRAFLFTLLRNFLSNRRRSAQTQKRGGKETRFDTAPGEREALDKIAASAPDPAVAYDQVWAMSVHRHAFERLREEQSAPGPAARFAALSPFLVRPPDSQDYDRLARELQQTRNQLAVALHRLSRRYSELIRAEVRETLANPSDVETELRQLIAVLSR